MTSIIYDSIFGFDVEIVTHKGETSYYVMAERREARNWSVMRFSSIDDIISSIKTNDPAWLWLNFEAPKRAFDICEAFHTKTEYNLWLNRQIEAISETYCYATLN